MKPDGVIAFHVTNRYLDLVPVVEGIAHELDLHALWISDDGERSARQRVELGAARQGSSAAERPATRATPRRPSDRTPPRLARCGRTTSTTCVQVLQRDLTPSEAVTARIATCRATTRAARRPCALSRAGATAEGALSSRSSTSARCRTRSCTVTIGDAEAAALAIRRMWIRGAPLIGAVGAYGLALALDRDDVRRPRSRRAHAALDATRPTAVNLRWALDRVRAKCRAAARRPHAPTPRGAEADAIARRGRRDQSRDRRARRLRCCARIAQRRPGPMRVMTHCNAGALATCGWGTATAPLFLAHAEGLPLHVWVSETRPRMQGANLTAWELAQRGIPHTLFADSAERPR